jgi:hypothetical protein
VLYQLACDESVARQRCLKRNEDLQGSFYICENSFDVLRKKFEPLDPDEASVCIDTTRSAGFGVEA